MFKFVLVVTCCIFLAVSCSPIAKTEQKAIINFQLAANNIADHDGFGAGESDPFAKVYHNRGGSWVEFGRSDTLIDTLNPVWGNVFTDAGYVPGAGQKWWIEIRDHDALGQDDHCGSAEIVTDDFFNDPDKILTVPLIGGGSATIKDATKKEN